MALISHYVVTYNHETHKFDYDLDTTMAKFQDGWVYDEESGEYIFPEEELSVGNDDDGAELLQEALDKLNQ